ncbi:ATP-binding protein [Flavicella sp.]|uniref:ATP-binding protein n=1 Tax=Flavicella sp. TaxID=2957742 RepID=UPI00261795B7|nr:ATP-binding protein [Flavicella sp.]MDG1805921.1 ATP-binding protein [Flavicella sp.]
MVTTIEYEDASPNPEHLIKSIAEQGYTLETALADLLDNSISAKAGNIEIMSSNTGDTLKVFITDNGIGMNEVHLSENMMFPSKSVENKREVTDLGRFGLGMKTASFSQTRKFTVLSREKGTDKFHGRTWDVNYLKKCGKWRIIVNNQTEILELLQEYNEVSKNHLKAFDNYAPNTIVIWDGLYKFENYLNPDNQYKHFKEQINTVTSEYLGIVFHKFMNLTTGAISIRINNERVEAFDPFISTNGDVARGLGEKEMKFGEDVLRMNAYVLPVEATENEDSWTTQKKNLMDLEGLYIYRGNRIIFFGGWNGIIKKETKLKLARLKIEFENINDDKLQLNVAKSKIEIPYELKTGVLRYLIELREQAKKEYNNRGLKQRRTVDHSNIDLLKRIQTTKGVFYSINDEFPLLNEINDILNSSQKKKLHILLRAINHTINKQRHVDTDFIEYFEEAEPIDEDVLKLTIINVLKKGVKKSDIYNLILKGLGFTNENIPDKIAKLLIE